MIQGFPKTVTLCGESFHQNGVEIAPLTGSYLIIFSYGNENEPNHVFMTPNGNIKIAIDDGGQSITYHLLRHADLYIPAQHARKIWKILCEKGWVVAWAKNDNATKDAA